MHYVSTRDAARKVSSAEAIVAGLAPDGGLYVPASFPTFSRDQLSHMLRLDYASCAKTVLGAYLTDFSEQELDEITKAAYGASFSSGPTPAPVTDLGSESVLELFHGPTIAFKDMALQILPHLLRASMQKTGETRKVLILVATSGDTGKAALDGFADVPGTAIVVFYPQDGVSAAQKLQMVTQEGSNVGVFGVNGNFDDAQTGVKRIFSDAELNKAINAQRYVLSSANSINWGRLAPQIAYYFWAYLCEVNAGKIALGDSLNAVVPTGNFGNILAAYYAKRMGLPIGKLICASNANNVLTDFFHTGRYDSRRPFHKTSSPSMDILVSSNLERLLFDAAGRDATTVARWMRALRDEGRYDVGEEIKAALGNEFYADYCDEKQSAAAIRRVFDQKGYVMDPHTAVAQAVYDEYRKATGDETRTVVVSTASPYKFATDVLHALGENDLPKDEFAVAKLLAERTKTSIPDAISGLRGKPVLHGETCEKSGMDAMLLKKLQSWNR